MVNLKAVNKFLTFLLVLTVREITNEVLLSFFIGLTSGAFIIGEKNTVIYDKKEYDSSPSYTKGGTPSVPVVVGYMYLKNRFQIKPDLSINLLPWKKTVGGTAFRDLGIVKIFAGSAINPRLTISGGVGVTARNATINFEQSTLHAKTPKKILITPFIGAEAQYKFHPCVYGIFNIHVGGIQREAKTELFATRDISSIIKANEIIVSKNDNGSLIDQHPIKYTSIIGRIMIGILYEIGGKK